MSKPCAHQFNGGRICGLCGWALSLLEQVVTASRAYGEPKIVEAAPGTVIVPCPECSELAEHDAAKPILECPSCNTCWAHEQWRTAEELIAFIRAELAEDTDASRRTFYNSRRVLFRIAQAVDAFPLKTSE